MKKTKLNSFVFSLLVLMAISLAVRAEDKPKSASSVSNEEYRISDRYKGGEFLIYDCKLEFFACVNAEGQTDCLTRRNTAISSKKKVYPCAPLRKFSDKESCVLKNYALMETGKLKRFCYPQD